MTHSFVDKTYGTDRLRGILGNNVFPDTSLDGMKQLMARSPIDTVWEFYGVSASEKNNLRAYLGKGIVRADHVQIVEDHFEALSMPIEGWFIDREKRMTPKKEEVEVAPTNESQDLAPTEDTNVTDGQTEGGVAGATAEGNDGNGGSEDSGEETGGKDESAGTPAPKNAKSGKK